MSDTTESSVGGCRDGRPPIDLPEFRREMAEAELEDIVDELVGAFLEDAPTRMVAIESAVAGGVGDDIRFAAHAYKSAAASMCAKHLADLLRQLETAGAEGETALAERLLPQVKSEHEETMVLLQSEFADVLNTGG